MVRVPRSRGRSCSQARTQELGLRNCGPPWATGLPWGQESRPNPVFKQIAPSFTVLMNTFCSPKCSAAAQSMKHLPTQLLLRVSRSSTSLSHVPGFSSHLFYFIFLNRETHIFLEKQTIYMTFCFKGGKKFSPGLIDSYTFNGYQQIHACLVCVCRFLCDSDSQSGGQ